MVTIRHIKLVLWFQCASFDYLIPNDENIEGEKRLHPQRSQNANNLFSFTLCQNPSEKPNLIFETFFNFSCPTGTVLVCTWPCTKHFTAPFGNRCRNYTSGKISKLWKQILIFECFFLPNHMVCGSKQGKFSPFFMSDIMLKNV